MILRNIFLGLGLLTATAAWATHALDARRAIALNPQSAGGIYRAYPATEDSLQRVPEGYAPIYLSHYGRHGSRWVIKDYLYSAAIKQLREEKTNGNLTSEGEKLIPALERCGADAEGHFGELSPLGRRQHRGIASRMMLRFPMLFNGEKPITARSSTTPRCIVSMASFTEELTRRNPGLEIDMHASPGDMPVLALDNKGEGLPLTLGKQEAGREASWRYSQLRDSLTRSESTARRFFHHPEKLKDLPGFMRMVFDAAIAEQESDKPSENLLEFFEPEDLFNQWQASNYGMYMNNADPSGLTGPGALSAVPILEDILGATDAALASGKGGVDLRFGHDTVLLRLLSLMGADNCTASANGLAGVSEAWRAQDISPMAGNLQLAFFKNGAGEVIVAPRLNERPLEMNGVKSMEGYPGVYRWDDLRRAWRSAIHPASALINRVCPGSASRFMFEQTDTPEDFFEISACGERPLIRGNNAVNVAVGLNWYLKYYAGVHLAWNNLTAQLPATLPLPATPELRTTDLSQRYYLNYCTHSYSMAFWDRERWQQEVDWMALHGINMPLAIVGTDVVWRNTLLRLGYSEEEANEFVAGPAFQAWWLMNNLEGWGGPNSPQWYADRASLQRDILASMRRWGMEPVLPGYSGMVPHDADERLGMDVSGKGLWNGFVRPAFLKSTDPQFNRIADIYYDELTRLCGKSKYYSMDPFHEGGSTEGVDLAEAAGIITRAMKRANPEAVWVVQGWNENPRAELLRGIPKGDVVVLDLASEIKPNWGDPDSPSPYKRAGGYDGHNWMFCMLLNFGGNVGLHGRFDNVTGGFYKARESEFGNTLTGFGLTPEGIGNNPVMYELMSELMWRPEGVKREKWLEGYTRARYGSSNPSADKAWRKLAATIYNCPWGNLQQGTTESVFCARPSRNVWQVSSWSRMAPYYKPEDVIAAAREFAKAAPKLKENANYRYDLVDITRQALAEKGRLTYREMIAALEAGDAAKFGKSSDLFLALIMEQDRLLSTQPAFSVQPWIDDARRLGHDDDERNLLEDNARRIITTWGPREASEEGGLRDYAHREWHGLLADVYYPRWERWIEAQKEALVSEKPAAEVDFFDMDDRWVNSRSRYELLPESESVAVALESIKRL